ncbi:MAG: hypothetical protein MUE96_03400 [Bacteroidia bacterium]|jgi:hypothetical protein|nr:hypothetical protein [Bacteroidia bacterium]
MKNKVLQQVGIVLIGFLCIQLLAIILYYIRVGNMPYLFNAFCGWDCGWYQSIKESGYVFNPNAESNPAFFPLFPYVWRLLDLGVVGISLVNLGFFLLSMLLLLYQLKLSTPLLLSFFCFGLVTFFMVPYSESLFFLGSSLFIVGFHKQSHLLIWVGFLIAVLARSAAILFVAASIILFVYSVVHKRGQWVNLLMSALAATVVATVSVFYIQYLQTGNFFAFFDAQAFWDHHLRFPSFPFTSWHWPTHISDSSALIIGFFCMLACMQLCLSMLTSVQLSKWQIVVLAADLKLFELFSLFYLAGTTATILLFQGGNLHSLNRYVFSTPFFLVLLNLIYTNAFRLNWKFGFYVLFCVAIGVIMPRQTYIEHYLLVTSFIIIIPGAILYLPNLVNRKWLWYVALFVGLLSQVFLLTNYWMGKWMG